jgi:hypothetical protein
MFSIKKSSVLAVEERSYKCEKGIGQNKSWSAGLELEVSLNSWPVIAKELFIKRARSNATPGAVGVP